jgi:hypothetical protein
LTLLKQARAIGLGIVLATQNPVDLDYKALSNAGTWFLGRLQTERDKARVLDGLEGVAAGAAFDRRRVDTILSAIRSRVFLMNNVHDDEPVLFQTRWALSYLRGPLTRSQIATLMEPKRHAIQERLSQEQVSPERSAGQRPVVPPGIEERFLLPLPGTSTDHAVLFRPALFGVARMHFVRSSDGVDHWETVALLATVGVALPDDVWRDAAQVNADQLIFAAEPVEDARFANLPAELSQAKSYAHWQKELKDHLYRNHTFTVLYCKTLKERAHVGESAADFRARLQQAAFERRDLEVERLRQKYAPKLQRLTERIRRHEQKVEREKEQLKQQSWRTALSLGTTVLPCEPRGGFRAKKPTSNAQKSRSRQSSSNSAS